VWSEESFFWRRRIRGGSQGSSLVLFFWGSEGALQLCTISSLTSEFELLSRPGMSTIFSVLVTLCGMNMSVSTDFGFYIF
jgi:hypothetical protein